MEELKRDFREHIDHDSKQFESINGKLDRLIIDVVTIKSQWKLVGAILGILSGVATSFLLG